VRDILFTYREPEANMMHPVGRPWWAGIYCGGDDGDVGHCNAKGRRRAKKKRIE
jgi:hypothetical protein